VNVDFAFICDYAEASGKLNALGIGFDTIFTPKLPARHLHFSLVLQIKASVVEAGQKHIQVNLIDEDGKDVIQPINGQINIPRTDGSAPNTGRFVMEFGNIEFKNYGIYSVRVVIEGLEMASLSFRVAPPPNLPGSQMPQN
jgi:hypothetical protein